MENKKFITQEEEFFSAEVNYTLVCTEYRQRIQKLQQDLAVISDPEVKGFAESLYLKLRKEYFDLLKVDIDMQVSVKTKNAIKEICQHLKENEVE